MCFKKIWEKFHSKADMWDYGLTKWSCVAFGVFLAALIPALLKLNMWWWLVIALVLALKPLHTAFFKK